MALFDAFVEYVKLTNPWGSSTCAKCDHTAHDGKHCDQTGCSCYVDPARSGTGSSPAGNVQRTVRADGVGAAEVLAGNAAVAMQTKTVDQLPPHIREMLGRG